MTADDEWDQVLRDAGYLWCRPHAEWHRPPECAIGPRAETVPWWRPREGEP